MLIYLKLQNGYFDVYKNYFTIYIFFNVDGFINTKIV